jgi:hypothetical protein
MPRKLRVEYPGAMYHLMSRGNRREDLFFDDVDRHDLRKSLAARLRRETTLPIKAIAARRTWEPRRAPTRGYPPRCEQMRCPTPRTAA